MFRSQLARRLVLPLLVLLALLFGLLAVAGANQAQARVDAEFEAEADRIAAMVDELALPAAQRPAILQAMTRLLNVELSLGNTSTRTGPPGDYRELRRPVRAGTQQLSVWVRRATIDERRADFLGPVLTAAVAGFSFVLLFGYALVRTIVRPVQALASSVRTFGEGGDWPGAGPRAPGELGELQDAFERMAHSVRENERLATLGRVAGGMAHELRNPLTAIRMAVETGGPEAQRIALGEIERLDRTLRELLDFARPRPLERSTIAWSELLGDVERLLGPQCEHLGVKLTVEAADGATVHADRDRLQQAILNLVLNAAQAQPQGGAVQVRGFAGGVEVIDEGPGIPERMRAQVFEPFVSTKAAGIGLGLSVVQRIVDEHGAKLELETGADGTAFRIEFPPA
ncbi:MAG: ATP-binding protein [Planctomycetota bacterium]